MRLLITGATGFVGRHLIAGLPPDVAWVGLARSGGAQVIAADVLDAAGLRHVMGRVRPDVVVHLAAISQAGADLDHLRRVNVDGAVHVAEATWAEAPRARLIVASTGYVLGETGRAPADERATLAPVGPYASSKAEMEVELGRLAQGRSLHILRPFNHTGPGQAASHAVPAFALKVRDLPLNDFKLQVGDLTAVRDLSDVRDLAELLVWLSRSSEPPPLLYACSGVGRPMGQVLDALLQRAGVVREQVRIDARGRSALRQNVGDPGLCRARAPLRPRPWQQTLDDVWPAVAAEALDPTQATGRVAPSPT